MDIDIKSKLDKLIFEYKVQPVGWGYIDCITIMENAQGFINSLTDLGIRITELTWWCHCADWTKYGGNQETGCPHGGGGPPSDYYDGCFSEVDRLGNIKFSDNSEVLKYIHEWPNNKEYLPCFVPAFWLDVPRDWRNIDYISHLN